MNVEPMNEEEEAFWLDDAKQIGPNEWVSFKLNSRGETIGIFDIHRVSDGQLCIGGANFDVPSNQEAGPRWTLNSIEPLDLSPSLLCNCGHHGFIKQGKWVGC